jgi:glutamate--cysteine ligase catalytic subunit
MGLLSKGTPLPWHKAKEYANHVRYHGIQQFLHIYAKVKDRERDCLLWGDEIEYMLLSVDHGRRMVKLGLRAASLLERLEKEEVDLQERGCVGLPKNYPSLL